MTTFEHLSPIHDQVSIRAPRFPLAIPKSMSELRSASEQSDFTSSLQPIYTSVFELEYRTPSAESLPSSLSQMREFTQPLLADPSSFIAISEPEEVEVDIEVWTAHTYQTEYGSSTYYTIRVPTSSRNVLIAHAKQTDDMFINVPDSSDHRWPVLTSKKHTVDVIPPDFEQWMSSIHNFLDKSAEYFRPYKRYVKRRCYGTVTRCGMLASFFLLLVIIHECFNIKLDFILWELVAILLITLFFSLLLNCLTKRGLMNGVEALKMCGKYEQCMLPSSIKVILGPYGAYWKFVLRN